MDAEHQCPWCSSSVTGFLSVGLSVLAGVWLAYKLKLNNQNNTKLDLNEIVIRSSSGLTIFLLVAFISAWISAVVQGYPTFIIS